MNCFAKFLASRLTSIGHAIAGIRYALRSQANVRVHLVATVIVILLGLGVGIGRNEWISIVVVIGLVWMAELFNTALEYLCDLVAPEHSNTVKRAKDLAAGAVLATAISAAIVGALVFWPHFFSH